jgi:uroporphyrinogen decarboxylase
MPNDMPPRERVLTTFAHREPDRVPLWFGMSPEFQANAKRQLGVDDEGLLVRLGDDFRRVFATYVGPPIQLQAADATYRTPFGVERHGLGYGQPIRLPLAGATLREIHDYAWPDPAWMDVSQIRSAALAYQREYAILGGDWSPFWHDAIDLLGMEDLLFKMHDEPALVDALLQHVVDYYFEVSRRIFDAAADAIDIFFIGNDFGSQFGPLVGPEWFARFLLPHLQRLIELGHAYGLRVQLHCCGGFAPLLPQMIKAGLDAVHAVQSSCLGMDLARLKADFGRQIVFNGAIDSHHALIQGTPDSVRATTRDVLRIMMPGGGYVAGASHDYILEETPVENVVAMSDAVREFGVYRRSN